VLIDHAALWLAETNCYAVAAGPGQPAVLIDAPPDVDAVVALLARNDLVPVALLVTHGHVDHTGGAGAVASRTGAVAYLHPNDDWLAQDPVSQLHALFGALPANVDDFAPPQHFEPLKHGQVLDLAGVSLEVRHTPGHTPGHCCFYIPEEGTLFSGDQLFAGSIGRTDLPGGDYDLLMESMAAQVLTLPDHTEVLPGHGPATTLAAERRANPFLQDLLR
jgi:glyoxylase-like metal-dependent hydrolase (beta-lactamase superfamily II)